MIGLGCMRLSTAPERDDARSIAVIHAALGAGATLLDTAGVYCRHEREIGHNERLIALALERWPGDRSRVTVATKGGLRRRGKAWVPDGRAKHLQAACEASRIALGVDVIDLYQLHAVDPRTPIETSVRALDALRGQGKVRRVGLCNVTVGQIETARTITDIDAVQVSLSVLDEQNFRNGVAEYCRDQGLQLIAYRPLGGDRRQKLESAPVLSEIAERHGVTNHELALAWLLDLDPSIAPIPGSTREETARSLATVSAIRLTPADRARLDAGFPAGRLLRVPRDERRPRDDAPGEVVIVMGMPAAGKSTIASEYVEHGYERLNRDERGGRLSDLVHALDVGLAEGRREWVLDNTYPTRASRNEVIECAWCHGVPVRCVSLTTSLADAQVNAITRMIRAHGKLPAPEELRAYGRRDPRFFGPDAQFRWQREVEPPVSDEGFTSVELRAAAQHPVRGQSARRAVFLEFDGVLCVSASADGELHSPEDVIVPADRRATLQRYASEGYELFAYAWRPEVAQGTLTTEEIEACFESARRQLGLDIDFAACTHPAGPPICWCRKPLPGLLLEFALARGVALTGSVVVGRSAADRTLARRLGSEHQDHERFFAQHE